MVHAEHYGDDHDNDPAPAGNDAPRAGQTSPDVRKKTGHLTPFTKGSERAREAGRRGGATRARNAAAVRQRQADAVAQLATIADRFNREELGPMAAAAAMHTIGEVVAGRIAVRDPAAWVRVLVDVARIEAGEITSATAHVAVTTDDLQRALALRDAARLAIGDVVAIVPD